MKKIGFFIAIFGLSVSIALSSPNPKINFQPKTFIQTQVSFTPNNISTFIQNDGTFNADITANNYPGMMWPTGSNRYSIFTSGLTIAAKVNGMIRIASTAYSGEYFPGKCLNGVPDSNGYFKLYKVTRGDGPANPDWANWYRMIPYGAPFIDINNNGTYEQGIDTPGVKYAQQTVFICMTDGYQESHQNGGSLSGGTLPLFSEMHLTAWGYNKEQYRDMQFLKMEIINRGTAIWDSTYMGLFWDGDVGYPADDYIGFDTLRQMQYFYNADNMDGDGTPPSYGANPPACGIIMLKGGVKKFPVLKNLNVTSSVYFVIDQLILPCEYGADFPIEAYRLLQGLKRDGSANFHPSTKKRTRILFPGKPEAFEGWTCRGYNGNQNMAIIHNCIGGDSVSTYSFLPKDIRGIMSSGADDLSVNPGDTQTVYICQLAAGGTNNFDAVIQLRLLADVAWSLYNNNFVIGIQNVSTEVPGDFSLGQNFPNPFNPVTKIKFNIRQSSFTEIRFFDITGKEVSKPVSERLNAGSYEISFDATGLPSGVYFYKMSAGSFSETRKMIVVK